MTERPSAFTLTTDEQDARQLEELVHSIETGFNHKDAATLDSRFTADAIMTVPDGTTLRGWDEICAYHTARLAGPVSDWSTCVTVVSVNSLSAGTAVIQMKQDTTTPDRSFSNRGTIVAVKKDGQWWISALQNTNVA